jgi:hypothetical protein
VNFVTGIVVAKLVAAASILLLPLAQPLSTSLTGAQPAPVVYCYEDRSCDDGSTSGVFNCVTPTYVDASGRVVSSNGRCR